jgi:putative transmembrane protein
MDKVIRIVLGIILIALTLTNVIGWWGWIGVVPLLTGLFSRCGLYSLLGINTCPLKK